MLAGANGFFARFPAALIVVAAAVGLALAALLKARDQALFDRLGREVIV